jgi:hypothetical protein
MLRRISSALIAAALFMTLTAGIAFAHTVGLEGEPDCFGNRISHGSASFHANEGHELTPVERAALLEETVGFFHTISPPDFQEFLEDFFGENLEVSVKEMTAFVRAVCANEVPFPEE